MRLAGHLGKSQSEILATHTSRDLQEWAAWDRISPIGETRLDYLAAKLCQMLAGAFGGKPGTLGEYMLFDMTDPEEKERQRQLREMAMARASGFGMFPNG